MIALTDIDSKTIWLNPAHIMSIEPVVRLNAPALYQIRMCFDDHFVVREAPKIILAKIRDARL